MAKSLQRKSFSLIFPVRSRAMAALCSLVGATLFSIDAVAETASSSESWRDTAEPSTTHSSDIEARRLLQTGVAAYKKRDYSAAQESLALAWERKKWAPTVGILAEVEMKLRRYRDAAEHWSTYLEAIAESDESQRKEAQSQLNVCLQHVGAIRLEITPSDGIAVVDGKRYGMHGGKPPVVWVEPGEHSVYATTTSVSSPEEKIYTKAGDTLTLYVSVPSTPDVAHAHEKKLTKVSLDRKQVVVSRASMARSSSIRTAVLAGESILTAVALGVGVGSYIAYRSAHNDAADLRAELDRESPPPNSTTCASGSLSRPPVCAPLAERVDDEHRAARIVNVAFPVAGALGLITIGTYLLWPRSATATRQTAGVQLAPLLSASNCAVAVSGWF